MSTATPEGALALRYEPTVKMSTLDRFWPVSVAEVLTEVDRSGGHVELVLDHHVLADPATLADLKPSDAPADAREYLRYPALLSDKAAQMRVFLRGLGVPQSMIDAWPSDLTQVAQRTAQIYFYDAGTRCSYPGRDTSRFRALQYWFFYGLNYYPLTVNTGAMLANPLAADTADIDFHEGDWEHITVLLDQHLAPQFVWMARHSSEGVLIPWDQVQHDGATHPVVYPAFGGHPSYPDCGAHPRALLAAAVYDYSVCGRSLYTFTGGSTRLVDLASVRWSCWPGYFGTTEGTTASSNADDPTGAILVAGPRSPLRQAENTRACT